MNKLVTIGIPVFNEEKHIGEVLDSILPDLDIIYQILIFDNASTDATKSICLRYAKKYPEIVYKRNRTNIGALKNIIKLVKAVKSKYYAQIGGHDSYPHDYLKALLQKMEDNEDAVNVFGNIRNRYNPSLQKIGVQYAYREKELRSEDWEVRFLSYLSIQDFNAPYYGLNRTKEMQAAFTECDVNSGMGFDNLVHAYMITKGKFYYVDTLPMKIQSRIGESRKKRVKRTRKSGMKISYLNPFGSYRKKILKIIKDRKEKNEKEILQKTIAVLENKAGIYANEFVKFFQSLFPKNERGKS